MHSSDELEPGMFDVVIAGRPAAIGDLFPGFGDRDRLGVIVRSDYGAVGASGLILATVTQFYEMQRATAGTFFTYPDYFVFHVGRARGDHAMFDIFRSHKEVVVADDPESILEAVNDRAITRLLVDDVAGHPADVLPDTRASAARRIQTVLAYRPSGRVADADVTVTGNDVSERYVHAVLDRPAGTGTIRAPNLGVDADLVDRQRGVDRMARERIRAARAALRVQGRPVESYRRITLDDGLARLTSSDTPAAPGSAGHGGASSD